MGHCFGSHYDGIKLATATVVQTQNMVAFISDILCYVQVEILYKLQLVQISCINCNLYKQLVQVAICTDFGPVQVVTCTNSWFYQVNYLFL